MEIEKTILKNLLRNEVYARKVLPFLKSEYFVQEDDKVVFNHIKDFIIKYNTLPTIDALIIDVESGLGLKEEVVRTSVETINAIQSDVIDTNLEWLSDASEKFCQEKAIYFAMMKSLDIMKDKDKHLTKGTIPQLLSDALAVSFDPNVGHDYLEQYDYRYKFMHEIHERIPFDLEFFNKITKNGIPRKTLNIILAGCVHPDTSVRIRFRKKI